MVIKAQGCSYPTPLKAVVTMVSPQIVAPASALEVKLTPATAVA
jgi:hypothetical protein